MRRIFLLSFLLATSATVLAAEVTILRASQIHTSNPQQPHAQAMAWDESGRIVALGTSEELRERYPQARQVDANGKTVIPGLIDAHGHVMGLGYALLRADLTGSRSKQDILARLREYEKQLPAGAWLLGGGWDQNDWPEQQFPTAADLDQAFPDRPVWLERVDGHAGWANSAALRAVAVKSPQPLQGDWQPDGGRIERANGKPSGVFVDGAMALVYAVVPAPSQVQREQALERALQTAISNGLTGVHDMGVSREELALMKQFADQQRLPLRIDAYADGNQGALDDLCQHGLYQHADGRLRMQGVKLYIDGALGSRGAALLADYSDEHGNRGLLVTDPAAFEAAVRKAQSCHVQVATHAIGDHGNRIVLDTYQQVLGSDAGSDHRWRVEHAQVLSAQDIPRFAQLHVIASMQPTHATSDMPWAQDRLGADRIAGAYAWQSLLDSGARLALGSDFPVESANPRLGLYSAVTRQDRDGKPPGGWLPEQRLSAGQALRGFTADAAHAGGDEKEVGQLAVGLRADFVILDQDLFEIPTAQLDELDIRSTWVDGVAVYTTH